MLPFFRRKKFRANADTTPLSPDEDVAVAQQAYEAGDIPHAVAHLVGALAEDAGHAGALALLETIRSQHKDPLSLVPLSESNFVGVVAVRALFLHRANRTAEAIPLIFQAALARPRAGFLAWAAEWLDSPDARGALNIGNAAWLLSQLVERIPRLTTSVRDRDWDFVPGLIAAIQRTQSPDTSFTFMAVALLRRLGETETSLRIAKLAYASSPDYYSCNAMASAYRSAGQPADAIAMYEQALTFEPNEESVMLDIGDLCCETGDMEKGASWYERVLDREPDHAWARPSLLAARYHATGESKWKAELADYAQAHPDNARARILANQFEPYFGGYLPEPQDATINAIKQLTKALEKHDKGILNINLSINLLESPSATLAAQMEVRRHAPEGIVGVTIDDIQQPDPRLPRVPVDVLLWKYDGYIAEPALPPPGDDIRELVADLARHPFTMETWKELAREAAKSFGLERAGELAAAMVYPSEAPEDMRAWTWLQRTQLAAALIIASLDEGWEGSTRRAVLTDIANGPMDWTVGFAAVALATIAQDVPEARKEVTELYRAILGNTPTTGHTPYVAPVIISYLAVPRISDGEREELQALLAKLTQVETVVEAVHDEDDDDVGYAPGDE